VEQLHELPALLALDDLVERGVDGVGERLGAENSASGVTLSKSTSNEVLRRVG
jgi:hypothetical protein